MKKFIIQKIIIGFLFLTGTLFCADNASFTVVNEFPHDRSAFTQGLVFHDGFLYEGTGLRGYSSLRKVDLKTGQILQFEQIPKQYFAEGIVIFQNKIYQLTWQSYTGFIYDLNSFQKLEDFYYQTEGWGVTHDDKNLYMSDGTSVIHILDPVTLKETRKLNVTDNGKRINYLNELEWIEGELWANVWPSDNIIIINPKNGQVKNWLNLSSLRRFRSNAFGEDVLNGIAYDASTKRIFVTGKLWPKLYEIKVTR